MFSDVCGVVGTAKDVDGGADVGVVVICAVPLVSCF